MSSRSIGASVCARHQRLPQIAASYSKQRTQQRRQRRRRRHCRCRVCRSADRTTATGNPVEVSGIDDPQPAPLRLFADRNLAHAVADAHLAGCNRHRHARVDQPSRHRVAVRVDLDGTSLPTTRVSSRNDPNDGCPPSGFNRCASSRAKRAHRRLAGRAVDTHVRHLTLPLSEMRLECFPALEAMPRDRVLLHVADAIARLALRTRPIWRAGARRKPQCFANAMSLSLN